MASTAAYDEIAEWYETEFLGQHSGAGHPLTLGGLLRDLLGEGTGTCLEIGCGTSVPPDRDIPARAGDLIDKNVPVVTYCWGPGCNGATRAALAVAQLGYRVREMIGGIEYWIREGFAVETATGRERTRPDPLTAPRGSATCAC